MGISGAGEAIPAPLAHRDPSLCVGSGMGKVEGFVPQQPFISWDVQLQAYLQQGVRK